MPQAIGVFIALIVVIFVVWVVAVAVLKALSLLIYVIPVVFAFIAAAGGVFSVVTAGWVLMGNGAPLPAVMTPQAVVDGHVFRRAPRGPSKGYGWDAAWPSYLPYQLKEDIRAIYLTQSGLIKRYWDGVSDSLVGTILGGIGLGVFGAVNFAVTIAATIALLPAFAAALLLRWALLFALRGLDTAYRLVLRSSAKCPHCYEPTTLPSFHCPDSHCSHVHRDLRPGRLGVVARRCACGTRLPTMVIRASLARLKAQCPSCNQPLTEGAGTRRNVQLPVFGTVASGKTRFLYGATVALSRRLGEQGGTLVGTDPESAKQLEEATRVITQRANTFHTDTTKPKAFGLLATPSQGRTVEIHFFDAAGEVFDNWTSSAHLRYLQSAEGLVFVIDPLTTPASQAALQRAGQPGVTVGHGSPGDSYDSTVEQVRAAGADLKKKSLAVVLSKADVLASLPVAGSMTAGDELSIHAWLAEHELDALLDRSRLDFKSVKFFLVNSLDAVDSDDPASPFHALNWLLHEAKVPLIKPSPIPTPPPAPVATHSGAAQPTQTPIDEFDWTKR